MKLQDYPRPANDNRRGIHAVASPYHNYDHDVWVRELQELNMKWYKILDDGGSCYQFCDKILAAGITPIVRLYQPQHNPGGLEPKALETISILVSLGVRYFEINNEPNLEIEWKEGEWQDGGRPETVMEYWIKDAAEVIERGGLPAFPALAQAGIDPAHGSVNWTVRALRWLADNAATQARDIFENGGWIAVHAATLNHPLDYPYDDVNQKGKPLTSQEYNAHPAGAWGNQPMEVINDWRASDKNPGHTVMDDDSCLLGFEVPIKVLRETFGLTLPVMSTEGGVFPPKPGTFTVWDRRYPGYDVHGHAERTVEMFTWLEQEAPDYFFAMCPWLIANERMNHFNPAWTHDAWYQEEPLPVVGAVKGMPKTTRPPIKEEAVEPVVTVPEAPPAVPTAEEPVSHYLLLGPPSSPTTAVNLGAAQSYIAQFNPTVGFNPEEAKQFKHVTIVGGPDQVSAADEQALREAGCQVERLENPPAAFAELVQQGKRFLA
ncbi:MAG: hypothetical protein ACE5NP_08180 [Anaerolineae bacterium]